MKDKEPLISIAIASYNYAHHLQRGFEAIKKQEFTDIEVVYCDDCSQDNSLEVIERFIEENPSMNIRLIRNEANRGLKYTKTRLIRECKGKYIMLCDADDWMLDGCLSKLVEGAIQNDADRVISEVIDMDSTGKILQKQDIAAKQSKWLWNLHHGCLYKRSILIDNEIEIVADPDDVYLITKFNQYCKNTVCIHEPLYVWFVHEESAGRKNGNIPDITQFEKSFQQVLDFISDTINYLHGLDDNNPVFEKGTKEQNIEQVEFLLLKVYYLYILHTLKKYSWKNKCKGYKNIYQLMKMKYPNYLKNTYLKFGVDSPARSYATNIIRCCAVLEKCHLMKIALFGYHILNKFIYFDQ